MVKRNASLHIIHLNCLCFKRKEKRKTLQDCEKFLNDISVSKFSEDYQENLKIKLNQIVKKKLATDYDPEVFVCLFVFIFLFVL